MIYFFFGVKLKKYMKLSECIENECSLYSLMSTSTYLQELKLEQNIIDANFS